MNFEPLLPRFDSIDPALFPVELEALLQKNLSKIEQLLQEKKGFTWEQLILPLEEMERDVATLWAPFNHLHAVVSTPALRKAYQACLPKLSAYESSIGHNEALYAAFKSIDDASLNSSQKKILSDIILSCELAGVALPAKEKQRIEAIQRRLSELSNLFENNVLDSIDHFTLHITEEAMLAGLPQHAIEASLALAKEKKVDGWLLSLQFPIYFAVMTYAENRSLRQKMHEAYTTCASEVGPHLKQWDNTAIINELLCLRQEKAKILGFKHYAALSLKTKMVASIDTVFDFLYDLRDRSYLQAKEEFAALVSFAKSLGFETIEAWDIGFLSEKMRKEHFNLSQEDVRPYFPLDKVLNGLFLILSRLYGLSCEEIKGIDLWHPSVQCYLVRDENKQPRGYLYMDLFSRSGKRSGAWMDSLQGRFKQADGTIQLPIATLTCNFAPPIGTKMASFSHDEVTTLFHELGHCLHHILTQVDYLSGSGINNVEWDAVELPSQFFENWCWEKEAVVLLSEHIDSREPLPSQMFEQLIAAKNFQSAMAMVRQLEFSLFDLRIHQEFNDQESNFVSRVLYEVKKETSVVPYAPYSRFQNSFSHIFAGGYAAGYYSYKWAEVLSADAFSRFEEEGIFNQKTGRDFLHSILEVGGAKKAEEAFVAFRGRKPNIDALLRHTGIGVKIKAL